MDPGAWTKDGFLGDDPLGIDRIDSDRALLAQFDVCADELGSVLEELWNRARKYGSEDYKPVPDVTVRIDEARGRMPCPFGHPGLYRKGLMTVTTPDIRLTISPLSIHMIKAHEFFGGRGSPFRLEPNQVVTLIRALPDELP